MSNSKQAVLNILEDDPSRFTFSFSVKYHGDINVEKSFNLNRNFDEPSDQFITRLNASLDKAVAKKIKRKKMKTEEISSKAIFKGSKGEPVEFPNDKPIKDIILQDGLSFHVLGDKYSIAINPPSVIKLTLSSVIMAGFEIYAEKLQTMNASKDNTLWQWFVTEKSYDESKAKSASVKSLTWSERAEGFLFLPDETDIGKFVKLRCTPRNEKGAIGVASEVISSSVVSAGPGFCPFENRHAFTKEKTKDDELRVLTYNILADLYADSDFSREVLHPQCPQYALHIDYRKLLMLKEISGYNCDVMCLQEVDAKIHDRDLQRVLSKKGFEGEFCVKGGQTNEGLSCFWNVNKFELETSQRLVLGEVLSEKPEFARFYNAMKDDEELVKNVMKRTTTLQTVVLKWKNKPKHKLIVANTHLYFKPCADNIRLLQAGLCLVEIQRIQAQLTADSNSCENCGIIFCGDFNSAPENGVLELVRKGNVDEQHADWKSWPGQEIKNVVLSHPYSMDSACGTPKYTNFTQQFADCLDYIFYDKAAMEVKEVIPFPSDEDLKLHTAIPNVVFPSDHVACVSVLKWKSI